MVAHAWSITCADYPRRVPSHGEVLDDDLDILVYLVVTDPIASKSSTENYMLDSTMTDPHLDILPLTILESGLGLHTMASCPI